MAIDVDALVGEGFVVRSFSMGSGGSYVTALEMLRRVVYDSLKRRCYLLPSDKLISVDWCL